MAWSDLEWNGVMESRVLDASEPSSQPFCEFQWKIELLKIFKNIYNVI